MEDQVSSPTFTLVKEYRASSTSPTSTSTGWNGCRTSSTSALDELGGPERVLLVEWGDAVEDLLPDERLRVELTTERADVGRAAAPTSQGDPGRLRWERWSRSLEVGRGPLMSVAP